MRRGSALLIVLGMISFLVVSAVAFSAFMRTDRLPSSYLLRSSSSRNLVKAGLAEALDEIDRAIGNNPHPGVGTDSGKDPNDPTKLLPNRNQWRNRIFLGTNMLISADQTVSTLTLEGLAYVPAPLVNEARYYSRRSPAGAWHTLGFDSGRFAFTAIDVSDYFDVNRTQAAPEGGGRTSADDARVTLAYLFEDENHGGWRIQPDAWDTSFMENYVDDGSGSRVPLVSWADLNLAIWDKKPAGVLSPWCRFIENGTEFVQDSAAERHALSNAVFVTDSWYPSRAGTAATKELNLAAGSNQPFPGLGIDREGTYASRGFDDILRGLNNTSQFSWGDETMKWADLIAPPELAQLCDYLDVDSVPTSLALPTFERTPLITGILPVGDIRVNVKKGTYEKSVDENTKYVVTTYELQLLGTLKLMVGAVCPFKHIRKSGETYKMEAVATIAFVPSNSNPEDLLRATSAKFPGVVHLGDTWNNVVSAWRLSFYENESKNSVVCKKTATRDVQVPSVIKDIETAVLPDVDLDFGMVNDIKFVAELPASDRYNADTCSFRSCRRQVKDPTTGTWADDPNFTDDTAMANRIGFLPVAGDLSGAVQPSVGKSYIPSIQFWVRLFKGNDTVDFVPACCLDDARRSSFLESASGSQPSPMLRFRDSTQNSTIQLTASELKTSEDGSLVFSPAGYVADDPRFNYAPENFSKVTGNDKIENAWKERARTRSASRDGDIFMETSDAGYLQSKYELMYLLRIANFDPNTDWGCLSGSGYNGKADSFPADAAMWRTYSQYRTGTDYGGDDFSDLRMVSGSGGTRVCPYTPDTAVMMGALANTPRDWWAASTNDVGNAKGTMLSNIDNALKYTFSSHSADETAKVSWQSLEKLAQDLIGRFRQSSSVDGWKTVYDQLDWNGTMFDSLEAENADLLLDSVDRKYLYGFWRECFAARQQLFLVFVRAEPMMMGSGLGGNLPPMLGARAVALVWRDPTATRNNAPHRMRILFYRQFD